MADRINKAHCSSPSSFERLMPSLQKKLSELQKRVDTLSGRISDQAAIKQKLHTIENKFQWLQKKGEATTNDAAYMLRRELRDLQALLNEKFP